MDQIFFYLWWLPLGVNNAATNPHKWLLPDKWRTGCLSDTCCWQSNLLLSTENEAEYSSLKCCLWMEFLFGNLLTYWKMAHHWAYSWLCIVAWPAKLYCQDLLLMVLSRSRLVLVMASSPLVFSLSWKLYWMFTEKICKHWSHYCWRFFFLFAFDDKKCVKLLFSK